MEAYNAKHHIQAGNRGADGVVLDGVRVRATAEPACGGPAWHGGGRQSAAVGTEAAGSGGGWRGGGWHGGAGRVRLSSAAWPPERCWPPPTAYGYGPTLRLQRLLPRISRCMTLTATIIGQQLVRTC